VRREPAEGEAVLRSQQRFIELARERARAGRLSMPSSPFRLLSIADRATEAGDAGPRASNESAGRRKRRRGR
jgi:hypothetical protein